MVAIIKTGSSIRRIFYYNDNKVKEGVAQCIMAGNYPMALEEMSEKQRLNMLLKTAEKNPNVKANSVHISLNFAPGEELSHNKLRKIASEYMEKIGFGEQPYLVYQHHDAGHCHIHIATVKVRPDGSRIDMNNIGRNQSEQARKEIELKHGLVRAEEHRKQLFKLQPVNATKVRYGKTETKRAITNVLGTVLGTYRYASLPELNAVLNLYNVHAERGSEDSRTYKNNGLFFRVLDADGQPVGVPIKASLFYNKPTLKTLEARFAVNDALRQPHKARLKTAIDFALRRGSNNVPTSLESMIKELDSKGIDTVLRRNAEGRIYGITFVDHTNKSVWNGSDLGKEYGAKGILERCGQPVTEGLQPSEGNRLRASDDHKEPEKSFKPRGSSAENIPVNQDGSGKDSSLLADLFKVEQGADYLPGQWKRRRKRKAKGRSNGL